VITRIRPEKIDETTREDDKDNLHKIKVRLRDAFKTESRWLSRLTRFLYGKEGQGIIGVKVGDFIDPKQHPQVKPKRPFIEPEHIEKINEFLGCLLGTGLFFLLLWIYYWLFKGINVFGELIKP